MVAAAHAIGRAPHCRERFSPRMQGRLSQQHGIGSICGAAAGGGIEGGALAGSAPTRCLPLSPPDSLRILNSVGPNVKPRQMDMVRAPKTPYARRLIRLSHIHLSRIDCSLLQFKAIIMQHKVSCLLGSSLKNKMAG